MQINWFTIIAQIINFLLLAWLLKRFLYKPILDAIDTREKKITDQIEHAQQTENEAKKEKTEFLKKNETFDKERATLMGKVIEEAGIEKNRLQEETKNEILTLSDKMRTSLNKEQEQIGIELTRRTTNEVFEIAKKVLKELSDKTLEDQITHVFIKRLKQQSEEERKNLTTAFASNSQPIIVRSAFELSSQQQEEIIQSVNEFLSKPSEFNFKVETSLLGGIELNVNGYKVAWSISEFLTSIEKTIHEVVNQK
ncbi:MAG TPA: F0F1 ATP synthase subunit delta [Cytophagaceae bacterium]|jgi:F-type H+-transporting ATPase subunit b|nr:F0F1 ATP synthase subunit delta [Cytophagaceae bacterium]